MSGETYIMCGVPQGSVLWPILFLLYINDPKDYVGECSFSLYADDTVVYCVSRSYVEVMLSLRIELSNTVQWLRANKWILNVNKTIYMIFGNRNKPNGIDNMDLKAEGEIIERVQCFKYLGMWLDDCLSFDQHIDNLYRKTCSKLGAIKKARMCLDQDVALSLYKS